MNPVPFTGSRQDVYLKWALWAIELAETSDDLRHWWKVSQGNRDDVELNPDEIDQLAQACRIRIEALGETPKPKPKRPPKHRRGNKYV